MDNTELKKLHDVGIQILNEVVRICEKYKITYYFTGGTLLGAIRHKGFIPWDDDIDIAMPRKDFEFFKKLCLTELKEEYLFQDSETENQFLFSFAKIRKKNTIFEEKITQTLTLNKGIFIDIFILDNAYSSESLGFKIQEKSFEIIQKLIMMKIFETKGLFEFLQKERLKNNKFFLYASKVLLFLILKIINIRTLYKLRKKIISHKKESEYYINFGTPYDLKNDIIEKEVYSEPIKVFFEGKEYNAPKNWEVYLKKLYGNYMELPPEEKRTIHFIGTIKF